MAKANPKALGKAAPKLVPDDLEADVAVLTIAGYEEATADDDEAPGGKRLDAWLLYEETGDKRHYLNVTQAQRLVDEYGDETDDWIGKPCPVEKVKKSFGGKVFPKVWVVVDAEEFASYLDTPTPRRKTVAPVGAPRRKKKAVTKKKATKRRGR